MLFRLRTSRLLSRRSRPRFFTSNTRHRAAAMSSPITSSGRSTTSSGGHEAAKSVNVLGGPLIVHSLNPITGFFRNGFCDTDAASDAGNHSVAGVVTEDFLDFSAARGNDLRAAGLRSGCRWCLCVGRWREAFDAFKANKVARSAVPRVFLEATHRRALEGVSLEELREFASSAKRDGPDEGLQFWLSGDEGLEKKVVKDEDPNRRKPPRDGDDVAS